MKRLNKKGFTLIELLAVIIILGILMIIAIPSVTSYIQNSRKSAYADTAVQYADAVMKEVNGGKTLRLYSTSTLYLIPVGHDKDSSCVTLESGGQSPFDDTWRYAYVGVTYDGKGYNYYFIGEDGAGQGISFIDKKTLTDDGTDYIYSSYKGDAVGDTETLSIDTPKAEIMSKAFAADLAGKYTAKNEVEMEGTGTDKTTFASGYKEALIDFIHLAKVEGTNKKITKIVFVGKADNCVYKEQITANNP